MYITYELNTVHISTRRLEYSTAYTMWIPIDVYLIDVYLIDGYLIDGYTSIAVKKEKKPDTLWLWCRVEE